MTTRIDLSSTTDDHADDSTGSQSLLMRAFATLLVLAVFLAITGVVLLALAAIASWLWNLI